MNYSSTRRTQLEQHYEIAQEYVKDIRGYLQQLYTISNDDANSLILYGLGDVFKQKPSYWNKLLSELKTDNATIEITADSYKKGRSGYGTKCQ
jgi:phage tail tape-measure protein